MDAFRLFFAYLVVVFVPPALVWWLLVHPFTKFWRPFGARKVLAALVALLVVLCAGMWLFRRSLIGPDFGHQPLLLLAATWFMVGAIWIAVLRRPYLTTRILVGLPELEGDGSDEALLNQGIYSRIRHPRYVEVALGVAAYALVANHLGPYLVALATVPMIHVIVIFEERELKERFGQRYIDYAGRVPRYLPKRSA